MAAVREKRHYKLKRQLSTTSYLAADTEAGNKMCIVKKLKFEEVLTDQQRADILQIIMDHFAVKLQHPYILGIQDAYFDGNCLDIVQEYAEGGTLQGVISRASKDGENLHETEVMDWFVQILQALGHIHSNNMVHWNWETSSVLLKSNRIKLGPCIDLQRIYDKPNVLVGASVCEDVFYPCASEEPEFTTVIQMSHHSMAPEIIKGQQPTSKVDIWGLGCLLYVVCAQQELFPGSNNQRFLSKVLFAKLPPFPDGYPEELGDLWIRMMSQNPDDRPAVADILDSPYFSNHLKDMEEALSKATDTDAQVWDDERSSSERVTSLSPLSLEDEDLQLDSDDERELLTGRRDPP